MEKRQQRGGDLTLPHFPNSLYVLFPISSLLFIFLFLNVAKLTSHACTYKTSPFIFFKIFIFYVRPTEHTNPLDACFMAKTGQPNHRYAHRLAKNDKLQSSIIGRHTNFVLRFFFILFLLYNTNETMWWDIRQISDLAIASRIWC